MTEAVESGGAGAMLRAARERQGLHLAALAASVKVTPRKLEALENDRWDELPDATFVRALAQTICRQLKVDPAPVLARLPALGTGGLGPPRGGLNQPFRDRQGRDGARLHGNGTASRRPLVWAAAVLVVGAAALLAVPDFQRFAFWRNGAASVAEPASTVIEVVPSAGPVAPAASAAPAPFAGSPAVPPAGGVAPPVATPSDGGASAAASAVREGQTETVFSTPSELGGSASAPVAGLLGVSTQEPSWVEVRDGRGRLLLARTVTPGEGVGLDGVLPLRVTVGNAVGTKLVFRGRPVDVMARARENVARLELQ